MTSLIPNSADLKKTFLESVVPLLRGSKIVFFTLAFCNIYFDFVLRQSLVYSIGLLIALIVIIKNFYFGLSKNLPLAILRFICIIVLSFLLPIESYFRIILLSIIYFLGGFISKKLKFDSAILNTNSSLSLIILCKVFISILLKFPQEILQFLTLGYDNALHFSLLRSFIATPWFPFISPEDWSSKFSLVYSYPSGQAAFYSFVSSVFLPSNPSVDSLLVIYFFIGLASVFSVFLMVLLPLGQKLTYFNTLPRLILALATSIMGAGVLFTSGFPPYLLGIVVFLLWLLASLGEESNRALLPTSLSIPIIQVVCPAMLPFLFLPLLSVSYKYVKSAISKRVSQKSFIEGMFLLSLALITLLLLKNMSGSAGWRQILLPGGVQPPYLVTYGTCFILAFFMVFRSETIIKLALMSSLIATTFFIYLTVSETGSIQYYAVKQFYLFLILAAFISSYLVARKPGLLNVSTSLVLATVILIPAFRPHIFQGGFMGTLPKAIVDTSSRVEWSNEPVNSLAIVEDLKNVSDLDFSCIVIRDLPSEADLSSRWLNTLNAQNLISDECFSIFGNPQSMDLEELAIRINKSELSVLVILDPKDFTTKSIYFNEKTILYSRKG